MLGTVEPGSSLVSPACLLSSEHLALASTFVPMQADFILFFLVLFLLVLTRARSLSCYSGSMNILLLMEKLIRPSHLVVCLTAVSVKGSDHVSLLSMQLPPLFLFFLNIIELPSVWNDVLLLLLTWTSNLWCVLKSA